MKKIGVGSRLLSMVLVLTMLLSMVPLSVLAAEVGTITGGSTGLSSNINTLDTISWPIKVYDYLNDGMLFEYASAADSALADMNGDAYGGGEPMPGDFYGTGSTLGNDYTVITSETDPVDFYHYKTYTTWLQKSAYYVESSVQQGKGTAGAFKYLRLKPRKSYSNAPAMVVSDFKNDASNYSGQTGAYAKDRIRYAVLIYKTNVSNLSLTMGLVDSTGANTVLDYNNKNAYGPDNKRISYDTTDTVTLTKNTSNWNYIVVDMKSGAVAGKWDNGKTVTHIVMDPGMTGTSQYLDLSHVAYFSNEAEALRFAERAVAFSNNPGYFLPDQSYKENGTTKYKHWNMGNNNAFTMLRGSNGGGWSGNGGANSLPNGYYSYYLGVDTTSSTSTANTRRTEAKKNGCPVPPDDIFYFSLGSNKTKDLSTYNFGYTLYNTLRTEESASVMTAGLLRSGLVTITGVDGKSYRVPEYKEATVAYIANLLKQTLAIGQMDKYGNYNYNFVRGSVSSQFADANGNKRDLATALREALGMTAASGNKGNYTLSDAANEGSYAQTKARQSNLIGPYAEVIKACGNKFTYYDAAFYLLHNLFVDNSYNQLQDDYNYLVLSKATVTATGKESFVFDAGFTTGNGTADSQSAVVYNENNGTISLSTALGKDQFYYSSSQTTTRYPFLPIQDPEGDYRSDTYYNSNGTPYFEDDDAISVTDYGGTYATRNYNYVLQANAEFVYHYQDDLFFQFQGDDDVYLFVNGELVLDIGAAHSITSVDFFMNKYVLQAQKELAFLKQDYGYRPDVSDEKFESILDAAVKKGAIQEEQKDTYRRWHRLNLVDGETYPIDFYYMERHGWGANMRVATNILMTDPAMRTEKKAYQDGAEIKYGGIVDGSKLIEYGFSTTNEGTNKLYNVTFNDYNIGVTLSPEDGLKFHDEDVNGVTVCDARGQKLDPSDLMVTVTGYRDEAQTQPVSINVHFDGLDPNGELKQFLKDFTSNDGTDKGESESLFAGTGLWRHATVTIRGIYYRMTEDQINNDQQFNNVLFTTANPAVDSDLILNSADTHQVRVIGDARHIYQWAQHEVSFTRADLLKWMGGSVTLNNTSYTASQIKLTTCRMDGTTYDFPDIIVRNNESLTVNYLEPGTWLTFIKVYRDTNNDGNPDDLNNDGILEKDTDYLIVPLAVFATDLQDDVVVLDYGLKADLTGKNGITANDYITVPNVATSYSIMGMTQAEPTYLKDFANTSKCNYNRISFAPVSGKTLDCTDGTYEYFDADQNDKLRFTPKEFMDETYTIYMAVTIHEGNSPSAVGTANGSAVRYSIDITKEVQMYQKVTVLPASVMYYENDFAGLKYESDKATLISGTGSSVLTQGVDQSVNFGADQVYQTKENAQFSGNTMTAVKVTEYGKLAQFTFKGTGFEIISRTNAFDSASLVVAVRKDGKVIRTLPVITEFSNNASVTCKHEEHNASGHCLKCSTYVGHMYYQDRCTGYLDKAAGKLCNHQRLEYYLVGYINGADYGCEGDYQNMGQYKFVNGKLTATFKTDGYVFVKTTGNINYFMTNGYPGAGVTSTYLYNTTSPGLQADKLHVPGGVELVFTLVENSDGTLTLSYTSSDDDVTDLDKTVYFNNTDNWAQVYAYYWSITDATMVNWPGDEMKPVAVNDSVHAVTLPFDAEYVIFTDGNGVQTMDLTVPADNMVYNFSGFGQGWSVYNPDKTTLSFDNTESRWNKVYIYYWSEQDEQMVEWPGLQMTAAADNVYTAAIPSNATKVLFHNGSGSQTADLTILRNGDTYIFGTGWGSQEVSDSVRTIYFQNTAGWTNLHVHYWDATGEGNLGVFPGDVMIQQDGDIYKATIPAAATHVVFNNGTDQIKSLDLELPEDQNFFVYDQALADTVPEGIWQVYGDGAVDTPETPEAPTDRTIYLINSGNWSIPYAHYWNGGGATTNWPGVQMTRVEGNRYSVTVPADMQYIIFNDNSGTQSADMPLIAGFDTYDYKNNMWNGTEFTTRTIYLRNDTGWAAPCAYYWANNFNMTVWPGVRMTQVEGTLYSLEIPADATKIIFNNNGANQTADLNLANGHDLYTLSSKTWGNSGIVPEDTTTRPIYYHNTDKWGKVFAYYWSASNNAMTQWPGVEMTQGENGVYAADIPGAATFVIFTDYAGNQTADLTIPTGGENCYFRPAPACGTWGEYEAQRVLYFDAGSSGWSQVNAYYWSAQEQMVSWPGVAMTKVDGTATLYSVSIPVAAERVIFNGGGNQTADLSITAANDKYSYDTGTWSNTTRVIYYEGTGGGAVELTYSIDGVWAEAVTMLRIKNDVYSCSIPVEAKYVTFQEGSTRVGPVVLSDDHDLYTPEGWSVFDPAADFRRVIYFKNLQNWKNVYVYYWGENVNEAPWPGRPMTFVDERIFMLNVPAGVEKVIFNDGNLDDTKVQKTKDLTIPEGLDMFTMAAISGEGSWSKYTKTKSDAIHQVPVIRVDGLELGTYEVEIQGMPTYKDNVDWSHMQDYVKDTYMYIDGIRIYQPLGADYSAYPSTENGATFQELRDLILEGHAAVAAYDHNTITYSGNFSWTENRNGLGGDMDTEYVGNQLSGINDYLLLGPNNETYLNGNAQTQAVIFYVKEDSKCENHALQIAARGIDAGLFLGSTSSGVNATLYHGVCIEKPDGTIGYGWRPIDTLLSGVEQYYTVDYQDCPYMEEEDGTRIYQVALFVRSGMVSFTNVKFIGLELDTCPVGDATDLELNNGILVADKQSDTLIGEQTTEETKKVNNLISIGLQMEATQWIEDEQQTVILKYPALSFEDEIYYNVFFTTEGLEEQPVEMGLLVFEHPEENGTVFNADAIISGVTVKNGLYVARSQGVQAKDLGKTLYFRVFAQMPNGRYVYSKAASYSVRQYAKSVLEGDYSAETKALIASMLKYGEAARSYFGAIETIGDLITEDVNALVTDYRTDLLENLVKADAAKAGCFAATSTGFTRKAPAVTFDGAFKINYFFTPSAPVHGNMTLYYWSAEDYNRADQLTADNATGSMTMTPGQQYTAAITGIAAKDLDTTYYVAVVYQYNGQTYCSGVLAYSLAAYCNAKAAVAGPISDLAKATAVYGYYAKKMFG